MNTGRLVFTQITDVLDPKHLTRCVNSYPMQRVSRGMTARDQFLAMAFADEIVVVLTWIADFPRVRSLRAYRFLRLSDHAILAQGETNWVFVDLQSGRPAESPTK